MSGDDETKIQYTLFCLYLVQRNIEMAKSMVTKKNVAHLRESDGYGVVWCVCVHGPDDPSLLLYFLQLGAVMQTNTPNTCLHITTQQHKYKLMRAIIDAGFPINTPDVNGITALSEAIIYCNRFGAKMLMDAGATLQKIQNSWAKIQKSWAVQWLKARATTRDACIVILGLVKCKSTIITNNGRNVLWLIARCLWQKRGQL